jgi:hypothetical protein
MLACLIASRFYPLSAYAVDLRLRTLTVEQPVDNTCKVVHSAEDVSLAANWSFFIQKIEPN